MRRQCDEIWILDLGGEGRGTHQSDNVIDILTPNAITVAIRDREVKPDMPARVHYTRVEGTREEKLSVLDGVNSFSEFNWGKCPDGWQAPFRPPGVGSYFAHPSLKDLFPWQQSGVKAGRTWVIAPEAETLTNRWTNLLRAGRDERKSLFKDSPTGKKAHNSPTQLPPSDKRLKPITDLEPEHPTPAIIRFAYRSFDRQYLYRDARMLDRPGPALWRAHSEKQVYVTSMFTQALATGPALTSSALIPDLDHFRGSYGSKAVIPLYRNSLASQANILPGLLELLNSAYKNEVTSEDFLAYVYGILAQPAFTSLFSKELESLDLRVPITCDAELFERVRSIGAHLLWVHTYGERFIPKGKPRGQIPRGKARCTVAVPGDEMGYPEVFNYNDQTATLHVGNGEFAPVAPELFAFEVSGLKVLQRWLNYRMKKGYGRKSSPLNDIRPRRWTSEFNTELLQLLWVLEETLETYPEQAQLLDEVIVGDCFYEEDMPEVPEEMCEPPKWQVTVGLFDAGLLDAE